MSWFKRLCMFIFGLSGLLALVALSLTWIATPWTEQARALIQTMWYFYTLEVLVCISAVGLLLCLLISLFYPRNPKETVVAEVSGGQITVTRAAIVSQVRHVIESDGSCVAASVRVRMRKRGHIRVNARVTPRRPIDVVQRGELFYAALEEGLSRVCGDSVKSINIVFTEPEQQGPLATHVESDEAAARPERQTPSVAPAASITVSASTLPVAPAVEDVVQENTMAADEVFAADDQPFLAEETSVEAYPSGSDDVIGEE